MVRDLDSVTVLLAGLKMYPHSWQRNTSLSSCCFFSRGISLGDWQRRHCKGCYLQRIVIGIKKNGPFIEGPSLLVTR